MSKLLKNLVLALAITILLGVVYYFTFYNQDSVPSEDSPSAGSSSIALESEKILADTKLIRSYELTDTIFRDERFRSLKDFTVKLEDVDTGRENPFEVVR